MRATTAAFAAFVAVSSVASAAPSISQTVPALGGPEIPDADRTCTKSGEKCAGDAGRPLVEFKGCCDDRLACGIPVTTPDGLWGQFCTTENLIDATKTAAANSATGVVTTAVPTATTVAGATATTVAGATTAAGAATTVAGATTTTGTGTTGTGTTTTSADGTSGDGTASATDDDDGSVCFPADATVELEGGAVVRMADLSVGDMVKVGVNEFSRVFMFTHKMADEAHTFVSLKTESGASLELTSGHYLYANGALVAAKTVSVGDVLTLGNGKTSAVAAVGTVEGTGLFNPQTVNGNVVVNGVVSSTYTTAVEPSFAHAILAPFRMLNNFGFSFTALESGGGVLADVAPRGQAAF